MIRPKPFQQRAILKMREFGGRVLLADDMGLGKTICSLVFAKKMVNARPVLVICPASLKYNWEVEARRLGFSCMICEGRTPPPVEDAFDIDHNIIIINYDIIKYWEGFFKLVKPKLVVLDECQDISNRHAKRTVAARRIGKRAKYVLCLSGTPLQNRPKELFPVLNIIDRKRWKSFAEFGKQYCKPTLTPWGLKYDGADNLDELHEILESTCMIRRRKKEVLNLPDKKKHVLSMGLSDPHEYIRAEKNFREWIKKNKPRNARKALKAEHLTKIGYLLRLSAELKLEAVCRWIEFVLCDDQKLVVLAKHRHIIGHIHDRFPGSVVIDGSVKGRKRHKTVSQFQNDPKTRLLIGNMKAAGKGLTLTAANMLAFVELGWTPAEHTQGEDRIYRIGQEDECDIYYLIARNTIEQKLCRLLFEKQDVVSQTLDGGKVDNDFDIFKELIASLK